jgi:hypothetical protein
VDGHSTDVHPYARRRRKSLKRRVRHALERWIPLLLISVALLLSAGVVRVMEIGDGNRGAKLRSPSIERSELVQAAVAEMNRSPAIAGKGPVPLLTVPSARALEAEVLEDILGASVLERGWDEIREFPAVEGRAADDLDERAPVESVPPNVRAPVPEPTTLVLVATGLVWTSRAGRGASSPR